MILGEDHTKQLISSSPRAHLFYALKNTLKYMEHLLSIQTKCEIKFTHVMLTCFPNPIFLMLKQANQLLKLVEESHMSRERQSLGKQEQYLSYQVR